MKTGEWKTQRDRDIRVFVPFCIELLGFLFYMYVTRTSSIDYKMWRLIWLDWLPSPSTLCLSEITQHERESGQMIEEQRLEQYWHIIIAVGISEMTEEGGFMPLSHEAEIKYG